MITKKLKLYLYIIICLIPINCYADFNSGTAINSVLKEHWEWIITGLSIACFAAEWYRNGTSYKIIEPIAWSCIGSAIFFIYVFLT